MDEHKKEELLHEEHDHCGCGHDHGHEEHEHEEHDHCGCGHDHHHEHDHEEHDHHDHCDCGHDHKEAEHHILDNHQGLKLMKFEMVDLGCANCAAKMEAKISNLPEVKEVTITFATKQMKVYVGQSDKKGVSDWADELTDLCQTIEPEVRVVVAAEKNQTKAERQAKEQESKNDAKKEAIEIVVGAAVFGVGVLAEHLLSGNVGFYSSLVLFLVAYVLLGREVVFTALKNMTKGHVFDENFLMSLATIGAFVIGEYPEAVGVMLFYRIGELFEDRAVEKSRNQIMDVIDLRPEVVSIEENGKVRQVAAEDAKVGQIMVVRVGDRIPLDGVVVEGESRIDTSAVTGEPVPVAVAPGQEAVSGCVNVEGVLKIRIEKPLEDSMVSRILESMENAAASKPKMDRFITRFAKIYTPIVVLLALVTAIIPSLITGEWSQWIYTAFTFLVISCPCALVLSVPLSFFAGIGAGSKLGILFKGGVSLETLNTVKAVVMDKTGTVTKGNFAVKDVVCAKAFADYEVLSMAASLEQSSTHPIAYSIVKCVKERDLGMAETKDLKEIAGKGIEGIVNGKRVLCGTKDLLQMNNVNVSEVKDFGTKVYVAVDGQYAGCIVIADQIKEDSVAAIQKMNAAGKVTVMLTGDSKDTADAVAKETGIKECYSQLLPQDKCSKLAEVREKYGAVLFVGDGINDALVLAGADVSAAMGSGADAAMEAADLVFMTSKLDAVNESFVIAKHTNRVALQNVIFALLVKVAVMVLGILGFASMWAAVFADSGVAMLCVLNSIRILRKRSF